MKILAREQLKSDVYNITTACLTVFMTLAQCVLVHSLVAAQHTFNSPISHQF